MTKTKADIEAIERYLSDVDQYLVGYGIDPRERLDYIDEAADTLLQTSGDRPDDAFGPAEEYAANLASALGVSRSATWWRLAALFVGTWLVALCFGGLTIQYLPLPPGGLDYPFWVNPFSDIPTAFAFTFSAWALLTPSGTRVSGVGRGVKERFVRLIVATGLLLGAVVLYFNLVVRNNGLEFEPASLRVMLPVLVAGLVAGLVLIWRSRWLQTALVLLTTARARPDSSLTYNPFRRPTVRVWRTPPAP